MRRVRIYGSVLLVALAGVALAANVHLKPPNRAPSFVDHGLTLSALGELAGLGNDDLVVVLTAEAQATAVCLNPGNGEHQPPGQNPAPVAVAGAEAIPAAAIKNGSVAFAVTTLAPETPIAGAPDCPNPHWQEAITDLLFSEATLEIQQPPGTVVLTITCQLSGPAAGTVGSLTASGCP